MSNVQTPASRLEQVVYQTAKQVGVYTGHPQESTKEAPVANVSSTAEGLSIDLYLPEEVIQFLEKPLQALGLQLEPTETVHKIEKKLIRHYSIRVPDGKLVLIYLNPEDAQTTWGEFHYFGSLFAKDYKSIVVFSTAATLQIEYEEVLREWEETLSFERIGLVLEKTIEVLRNPEIKIVIGEIKDKFGLPEETSADDIATEERLFDTVKLGELIKEYFSVSELKSLCIDLDIEALNYENLEGDTLNGKVEALIGHAKRHGYLPKLLEYCKENREHVSAFWDEVEG